jgi:hypothetical protein
VECAGKGTASVQQRCSRPAPGLSDRISGGCRWRRRGGCLIVPGFDERVHAATVQRAGGHLARCQQRRLRNRRNHECGAAAAAAAA